MNLPDKIAQSATALALLNLVVFTYFSVSGQSGAFYLVDLPNPVNLLLLFYSPIVFTILACGLFANDFFIKNEKNWYCFFILVLAYLPVIIWAAGTAGKQMQHAL